MTWQPIETAPENTSILVCCEYDVNGETFSEIWVDALWQGEWIWWPKIITAPFKPNNWMPLPEPPK